MQERKHSVTKVDSLVKMVTKKKKKKKKKKNNQVYPVPLRQAKKVLHYNVYSEYCPFNILWKDFFHRPFYSK